MSDQLAVIVTAVIIVLFVAVWIIIDDMRPWRL